MCMYIRSEFFRASDFFCELKCLCSISSIGKENSPNSKSEELCNWVTVPHTNTLKGKESGRASPVCLRLKGTLPVRYC